MKRIQWLAFFVALASLPLHAQVQPYANTTTTVGDNTAAARQMFDCLCAEQQVTNSVRPGSQCDNTGRLVVNSTATPGSVNQGAVAVPNTGHM